MLAAEEAAASDGILDAELFPTVVVQEAQDMPINAEALHLLPPPRTAVSDVAKTET